jgi:hypothetical protein
MLTEELERQIRHLASEHLSDTSVLTECAVRALVDDDRAAFTSTTELIALGGMVDPMHLLLRIVALAEAGDGEAVRPIFDELRLQLVETIASSTLDDHDRTTILRALDTAETWLPSGRRPEVRSGVACRS